MAKPKIEVYVNDKTGADTIDLEMTSDQVVKYFEHLTAGEVIYINLKTPKANGQVRENPAAYAVE